MSVKKSGISWFIIKFIVLNLLGLVLFVGIRFVWDTLLNEPETWSYYFYKESIWLIPLLPLYFFTHFKMVKPFKADPNYHWYHNHFKIVFKSRNKIEDVQRHFETHFPTAKLILQNENAIVYRLKSKPLSWGEKIYLSKENKETFAFRSESAWYNLLDLGVNYRNCYLFIQSFKNNRK